MKQSLRHHPKFPVLMQHLNDQLLENLKGLIENPEKRKELGEAGAAWTAKHSWEKIAQRLYELA